MALQTALSVWNEYAQNTLCDSGWVKESWACRENVKNSRQSCWQASVVEAEKNNEQEREKWGGGIEGE